MPLISRALLVLVLAALYTFRARLAALLPAFALTPTTPTTPTGMSTLVPQQPAEWRAALDALPSLEETKGRVPAFFIAHGQPTLIHPRPVPQGMVDRVGPDAAPGGRQEAFLQDLGRVVMDKYKPKAVVIFSAHWEAEEHYLVSDYEGRNPILYDYYGFPAALYKVDFKSHGSSQLSHRIVSLLQQGGLPARTLGKREARGIDGKTERPGQGFDHGCLVPLRIMFDDSGPDGFPVPLIQVTIAGDPHSPATHRQLGNAVRALRDEGVLVLAGGLTVHNLRSFREFREDTASDLIKTWHRACVDALVSPKSPEERHRTLADLEKHMGFRQAHPRADHFAPIWVADGLGSEEAEGSGAVVLSALHGAISAAFL